MPAFTVLLHRGLLGLLLGARQLPRELVHLEHKNLQKPKKPAGFQEIPHSRTLLARLFGDPTTGGFWTPVVTRHLLEGAGLNILSQKHGFQNTCFRSRMPLETHSESRCFFSHFITHASFSPPSTSCNMLLPCCISAVSAETRTTPSCAAPPCAQRALARSRVRGASCSLLVKLRWAACNSRLSFFLASRNSCRRGRARGRPARCTLLTAD